MKELLARENDLLSGEFSRFPALGAGNEMMEGATVIDSSGCFIWERRDQRTR